jgi:hypothetical protein
VVSVVRWLHEIVIEGKISARRPHDNADLGDSQLSGTRSRAPQPRLSLIQCRLSKPNPIRSERRVSIWPPRRAAPASPPSSGLTGLGTVDPERNRSGDGARVISRDDSPTAVLVVPTNEELAIARAAWQFV